MRVPEGADRDFVAGCYVVRDDEILLVDHEKLGMWLQPGGHIDPRETPNEAAVRECREETGWTVELVSDNSEIYGGKFQSEDLPVPFNVNLHRIRDGHWHCEFCYLATPLEKKEATHSHEHGGQKWFTAEEVRDLKLPSNVTSQILQALRLGKDAGTR